MPISRFGFTVGSHVGVAVKRNKTKRRLKEVVGRTSVEDGWDVVIVARKGAPLARFQELERSLIGLLRKARIATQEMCD
jgi:ribonuclease P protein component